MKKIVALVMFAVLPMGCEPSNKPASGETWRNVYITTHDHDGHKFVVATGYEAGPSIIHHPSCECIQKAK